MLPFRNANQLAESGKLAKGKRFRKVLLKETLKQILLTNCLKRSKIWRDIILKHQTWNVEVQIEIEYSTEANFISLYYIL